MTVADLRESISNMDDTQLREKYELYNGLQSRGVQDEIMLTLLEDELFNRIVPA